VVLAAGGAVAGGRRDLGCRDGIGAKHLDELKYGEREMLEARASGISCGTRRTQ
jgi:hypothetical protein